MKLQAMMISIGQALCTKFDAQAFSMLATDRGVVTIDNGSLGIAVLSALGNWILNLLMTFVYTVCKFVMNIIDFFQVLSYKLIGVGNFTGNLENFDLLDTSSPFLRFLISDTTLKVFTSILIIAIVLLIVFTIMAIVRSEYIATGENNEGAKGRILKRVIKSIGAMILFPCVLLASIVLINAILASLMTAFTPNPNTTVGGNVFMASAYNANNYRNYANKNARIPILIDFEDPEMYTLDVANTYSADELNQIYSSWEKTGKSIYTRFAYNNFDTFSNTVYYKNNIIHNNKDYSGFEKFVCTPEQYLVMADFIDYAIANNLTFYIKAYDDPDVDWHYVNNAIYDEFTKTFKINYVNSNKDIGSGDYYTVIYQAKEFDFDTPIQATLQTINQILSIGEFEDYQFKMLERVPGAKDENMVRWKTEKVKIKLSDNYETNPTATDQLILYEYYRKQYNNTFNAYAIGDLKDGVEFLSVMTLHHTRYSPSLKRYVEYGSEQVCLINGSYYKVVEKHSYENDREQTWFELDDELLNGCTYLQNGTTVKAEFAPTGAAGERDVVSLDVFKNGTESLKVKLPTDDKGRAVLYNQLRENYNESIDDGDNKYDELYKGQEESEDLINYNYHIYVDTLEDVCVTGTWTEKLVNDLQVIYKDINVNTLINTDQWLSAFSEMYNDKSYLTTETTPTATFNTTLIHPLGLIQSELFLGQVEKGQYYNSYAEFLYSSSYNDQIIKALFISMLGEDLYLQSYKQYQVFMDLFNCMMSSVLDETAFYEFFDIVNESNQSLQLYTYKAYLSSVLLSSDVGNFMYNIADTIMRSNNLLDYVFDRTFDSNGNISHIEFSTWQHLNEMYATGNYYDIREFGNVDSFDPAIHVIDYENLNEADKEIVRNKLKEHYSNKYAKDIDDDVAVLMLTEDYKNYKNAREIIDTFKVVYDYWQGESDANGEEYEFLRALAIYMSDEGFARSWAMGSTSKSQTNEILKEIKYVESSLRPVFTTNQINDTNDDKKISLNQVTKDIVEKDIPTDSKGEPYWKDIFDLLKVAYYYATLDKSSSNYAGYKDLGEQALNRLDKLNIIINAIDKHADENDVKYEEYKNYSGKYLVLVQSPKYNKAKFLNSLSNYVSLLKSLKKISDEETASIELPQYNLSAAKNLMGQEKNLQEKINAIIDLTKSPDGLFSKISNTVSSWMDKIWMWGDKNEDEELIRDDVWISILGYNYVKELKDVGIDASGGKLFEVCHNFHPTDDAQVLALQKLWTQMRLVASNNDLKPEQLEDLPGAVKTARGYIKDYVVLEQQLDMLNIFNLQYSIQAYASQVLNNTLKININNRTYTASVNMSSGKFVEYVLGYDKLVEYGYNPVFIDSNYQGILSSTTVSKDGKDITTDDTWAEFKLFLNKFGQACVDLSNKSAFERLEKGKEDNYTIDIYTPTGSTAITETILSKHLAQFLADNLSINILTSFVKLDENILKLDESSIRNAIKIKLDNLSSSTTGIQEFRSTVCDLMEYLGLTKDYVAKINKVETTDEKWTGFTLTQYKKAIMTLVYDYEEYKEDSSYDNQQRYVTLIYLLCSDWEANSNFYTSKQDYQKWIIPNDIASLHDFYNINIASLKKDQYSIGLIMRMSGLENRNINELVGLEFTNNLNAHTKSEDAGDVFIICTYDENERKFIPFLMANNDLDGYEQGETNSAYIKTFLRDKGLGMPYTNYYGGQTLSDGSVQALWYPVVAKGIITDKGYPTAIKENNGKIEFYRNDIRIVNTSKIGLSTYFSDTSMVVMRGGGISAITNMITKAITGRTLTQIALTEIPRIALDFDLRFAYGNSYNSVADLDGGKMYLDYNFSSTNGVAMKYLYEPGKINPVILVLSLIFLTIALWKMVWGLISRIFDVTVLSMISPAIFATLAFNKEKYDKDSKQYVDVYDKTPYANWSSTIKQKLLSVFGFTIALNIFFILVPIIREFKLFSDATAFASLPLGLGKLMNVNYINQIAQLIMTICAIYTIESVPAIFDSFAGGENLRKTGEDTYKGVKGTINTVSDYTSGRNIVDAKNKAIGMLGAVVPGSELMANARDGVLNMRTRIQANKAVKNLKNSMVGGDYNRSMKETKDMYKASKEGLKTMYQSTYNSELARLQGTGLTESQAKKQLKSDYKDMRAQIKDEYKEQKGQLKDVAKDGKLVKKTILASQQRDNSARRARRQAYRNAAFPKDK